MTKTLVAGIASTALLASGSKSQIPTEGWVAGGMTHVLAFAPDGRQIGSELGQGGAFSLATDGDGVVYACDGAIASIQYDRVSGTFGLRSYLPYLPFRGRFIASSRDRIWQIGLAGEIGYVHTHPLRQPVTLHPGMLATLGLSGRVTGFATDGREVFFAVDVVPGNAAHVWSVEFDAGQPTFRALFAVPAPATPRRGPSLALGANHDLVILDEWTMTIVDIETGGVIAVDSAPSDTAFLGGNGSAVVDPWTGEFAAAPFTGSLRLWRRIPGGTWQMVAFGGGVIQAALAAAAPRPFEIYGRGCHAAAGLEPRLGWAGLPRQGQAFDLTIRQLEQGALSVCWVGVSDSSWAGMTLPYEGSSLGAPGCRLLASIDAPFFGLADANGRYRTHVAVPVDPALSGLRVFSQGACMSGVNAFGFAFSDALTVLVR
ncbi:MAG: hypothetical protein IPK26_23415 [Planctomycetes bacterium]|nr:hypothetical protein [Planctomycetota bacterium]